MNRAWFLLRQTYREWADHEAPRLGAALAFYTILSLSPLMILVIRIVAVAFGSASAQSRILDQIQSLAGREGAEAVRTMVEHTQNSAAGGLSSVIGLATLLFGASGVFVELRSALNKIWDVKADPENGVGAWIRDRLFSVGMVLAIGFLLLVSLVLSAGLAALGAFYRERLPLPEAVLQVLNFFSSFGGITVLFALIFKFVPQTKILWSQVWAGAATTAFFFTVGKSLIGFYLGKAALGSAYGAAGSLVVMIVWIYYSSQIFFFGAELTHVLAQYQAGQLEHDQAPP